MKYNNKMDAVKFLCSIAVVLIHLTGFIPQNGLATNQNYYIYRYLLNIAVPFYFATTGYLLSQKSELAELKQYTKKIFIMYIFFSVLYIFLNIGLAIFDRLLLDVPFWNNVTNILKGLNIPNIYKGIFGSFHLWYLMALVLAVSLLIVFLSLNINYTTMFLISTIIYSADIINLIDLSKITSYGGFPKGFFYLCLGYLVAKSNLVIKYPLIKFLIALKLYSLNLIYNATGAGEILLAVSTFYLIYYCAENPGNKTWLSNLGKHSLEIYIMHIFVYQLYFKILGVLGVIGYQDSLFDVLLTTVVAVVFSIILYVPINRMLQKVNNHINFSINS